MTSEAATAHLAAKERLQKLIAAMVGTAWTRLGHYDQAQVDQFLAAVLPLTAAANRQVIALTQAMLGRVLGTDPPPVDVQEIVDGIRNGAAPAEVYKRPFVTVWGALGRGIPWADAVQMGLVRASAAAETDVQLAFTHTLRAFGSADGRISGWQRVPDSSACDFCTAAAGLVYRTGDLMPLHSSCRCGVAPLTAGDLRSPLDRSPDVPEAFAPDEFSGPDGLTVAVRDHGELGPVLTNAADHFTGPSAIPSDSSDG